MTVVDVVVGVKTAVVAVEDPGIVRVVPSTKPAVGLINSFNDGTNDTRVPFIITGLRRMETYSAI